MSAQYPYIEAWAIYLGLGRDWLNETTARAIADRAPRDAWAWSVGKQDWSTMGELHASGQNGNAVAAKTHKALTVIGRMIEDDASIVGEMIYGGEGTWE